MKLWSIWSQARYDFFLQHRYLIGGWEYVDPDYLDAYKWLSGFVPPRPGDVWRNHTSIAPPPVWAWFGYQYTASSEPGPPDLDDEWLLPEGQTGYCVELVIDDAYVLRSQFNMWVEVLNRSFIPDNEQETEEIHAAEEGLDKAAIEANRQRTWPRIFDLRFGAEDYWGKLGERQVQACVSHIEESDVVSIRRFIAR